MLRSKFENYCNTGGSKTRPYGRRQRGLQVGVKVGRQNVVIRKIRL